MAAAKENRLPEAKDLERLIDVEIRPPIGVAGVVQVRVQRIRAGVGIHAAAPGILRLRGEGVRELMLHSSEQHIVVGFAKAAEGADAIYQRVQRRSLNGSESVCVVVVQGVMTGTACVAQSHNQLMT